MVRVRPNPRHLGLPARLRAARRASGLSAHALSLAAGLSHSMVGKLEEEGTVPGIDAVEQLAAVLHVSPCHLAYGIRQEAGAPVAGSADVGARLKEARERAGLARSALGDRSGISGQSVANIEDKGYKPGVDTTEQLARALGISPCWLAFGEQDEPARAAEASPPKAASAPPQPSAALTAKDLEPLVDRLSPEERQRLAAYALGRPPAGGSPSRSMPPPATRGRRARVRS